MASSGSGSTGAGPGASRVVVHVDADSFYSQVEYRRLGIPRDVPLAVNQWGGLIAVSYPARAQGVRRGDRVDVALQKCPQLVCVHVETRDEKGKGDGGTIQAQQPQPPQHDRGSQKACLDRYREASEEVMAVMARFAATIEKASIDEAYMEIDVGAPQGGKGGGGGGGVEEEDDEAGYGDDGRQAAFTEQELVGIDGHRVDPNSPIDRPLLLGARVVARLRRAVFEATGFTVSAGIAHNKMLAKLASSRNKPDRQTVVPASAVAALMATIPVKEIRGLGGKLGDAVLAYLDGREGARQEQPQPQQQPPQRMAVELQAVPEAELKARFGPKEGAWLHRICRGIDDEPVVAKTEAQSFGSFKSFDEVHTPEGVQAWLQVLAADLKTRLDREYAQHRRRATVLTLVYRGTRRADHKDKWVAGQTGELTPTVSRAGPMPAAAHARDGGVVPSEAALVAAGMGLFQKLGGAAALPCTRLGLCATKFVEMPAASILSFFGAAAASVSVSPKQQAQEGGAAASSSPAKAKEGGKQQQWDEEEDAGAAIVVIDSSPAANDDDDGCGGGTGVGGTRPCAKCGGKAIAAEEWAEHADWHVAVDLQRAYGGGGGSAAAAGGGNGNKGNHNNNKRPEPTGGQGARPGKQKKGASGPKSQTLDKFWNKK